MITKNIYIKSGQKHCSTCCEYIMWIKNKNKNENETDDNFMIELDSLESRNVTLTNTALNNLS